MPEFCNNEEKGSMKIINAFHMTNNPYWNIYEALVVDDLHQLGGVYKHLVNFVEKMVKSDSRMMIEKQYQLIPKFRGLRSFDNGFMLTSLLNPTYNEICDHMTKLLSVIHNLVPAQATLCVRAFLDFYIQITFKEHTEDTLQQADEYLNLFFKYLSIFQSSQVSSLNFPKIHMLAKYTQDIRSKGPVDGFSTNHGGRLHKANTKQPSKRTNQRTTCHRISKAVRRRRLCVFTGKVTTPYTHCIRL